MYHGGIKVGLGQAILLAGNCQSLVGVSVHDAQRLGHMLMYRAVN